MNGLHGSRAEAKAAGARHYLTGKPCVNGHVSRRFSSNGSCEQCANEQCAAWRKKNPEKSAECSRAWKADNAGKVAAWKMAARARDPGKLRAQEREYRERNPEKRKAAMKSWRQRNAARVAAYNKEYRADNRERLRAYTSTMKALRRAIEAAGITGGVLAAWTREQPKVCFYCGTDCEGLFHVDHFIPLARGGAHVLTNLRIACAPCNLRKNAKMPDEFMAEVARSRVNAAMFANTGEVAA